jgi:hypothetical protein
MLILYEKYYEKNYRNRYSSSSYISFSWFLFFAQWVISLNLVLAGLKLGLKNRQVSEKWVADDCSYLCETFAYLFKINIRILLTSNIVTV